MNYYHMMNLPKPEKRGAVGPVKDAPEILAREYVSVLIEKTVLYYIQISRLFVYFSGVQRMTRDSSDLKRYLCLLLSLLSRLLSVTFAGAVPWREN